MKIINFNYVKLNEKSSVTSKRRVMKTIENSQFIEGIDLTKLTTQEEKQLLDIVKKYEEDTKLFVQKAYRRFALSNMLNKTEEVI